MADAESCSCIFGIQAIHADAGNCSCIFGIQAIHGHQKRRNLAVAAPMFNAWIGQLPSKPFAKMRSLQVTATVVTFAPATVPLPLATVQTAPSGCVPTVTA